MIAAEPQGGAAVIAAIVGTLRGRILGTGPVIEASLETRGSYDHARFVVDAHPHPLSVYVLNEHMAVDGGGERLSAFPDVIALLDLASGQPVAVKDTRPGQEVAVLAVDRSLIPLASGVTDPEVFPEVEEIMGIPLARYL